MTNDAEKKKKTAQPVKKRPLAGSCIAGAVMGFRIAPPPEPCKEETPKEPDAPGRKEPE